MPIEVDWIPTLSMGTLNRIDMYKAIKTGNRIDINFRGNVTPASNGSNGEIRLNAPYSSDALYLMNSMVGTSDIGSHAYINGSYISKYGLSVDTSVNISITGYYYC